MAGKKADSLYAGVLEAAKRHPGQVALYYLGRPVTYKALLRNIHRCAGGVRKLGLQAGERVAVILPNCPQGVYLLYGTELAGGICCMIHPRSAPGEVAEYLRKVQPSVAVVLDRLYPRFQEVLQGSARKIVTTGILDDILPVGKKKVRNTISWGRFLVENHEEFPIPTGEETAVILFSGGTTGVPKGVALTGKNFGALSRQMAQGNPGFRPGDKMLCALPMFHGFGLGVCVHTILQNGGQCVLLPRFTPKGYAKAVLRHRCAYLAGVPALLQTLPKQSVLRGKNLGFLKGVFCGGDHLPSQQKAQLNRFLREHGAKVAVREGYGATETVAACCLMPEGAEEDAVGLPLPGVRVKIVKPGTDRELPPGEVGEILVSGPTVMRGYWNEPEVTAQTLKRHTDGQIWCCTGDLGQMDEDGFVYFAGRARRMIVTCGYNVYPARLEEILDAHPWVRASCVVGLPDEKRGQAVTAFVELVDKNMENPETIQKIMEHCREYVAKFAMPSKIIFCSELPKTPLGKTDYRALEAGEYPP